MAPAFWINIGSTYVIVTIHFVIQKEFYTGDMLDLHDLCKSV